jgi:hypothetical protein
MSLKTAMMFVCALLLSTSVHAELRHVEIKTLGMD